MKTIDEMLAIMTAYKDGKPIECRLYGRNECEWMPCTPVWDWGNFDYRVKTESKYVPFESAEEFLQAQRKHGWYLKLKDADIYNMPIAIYMADGGMLLLDQCGNDPFSVSGLLEDWEFADGTPCGKLEE